MVQEENILPVREVYTQCSQDTHENTKKQGIALDIRVEPVSAGKHGAQNPVGPLSGGSKAPRYLISWRAETSCQFAALQQVRHST